MGAEDISAGKVLPSERFRSTSKTTRSPSRRRLSISSTRRNSPGSTMSKELEERNRSSLIFSISRMRGLQKEKLPFASMA